MNLERTLTCLLALGAAVGGLVALLVEAPAGACSCPDPVGERLHLELEEVESSVSIAEHIEGLRRWYAQHAVTLDSNATSGVKMQFRETDGTDSSATGGWSHVGP